MRTTSVNHFILETLQGCQTHLNAHQVYEQVRQRLPSLNPSTVYRALERLALAGKVSVSDMGGGAVVYEAVGGCRHHHLVCHGCGAVITLGDGLVRGWFAQVEAEHHFQVATNHLVLFGYCEVCRQKGEEQE